MTTIMLKASMCEFYGGIYKEVTGTLSNSRVLQNTLCSALPEFNASIVVFLIKVRDYFQARCMVMILIYIVYLLNFENQTTANLQ